jgi:catechol 2,3-dioxygenase-like lactoylglutathione lyase family enzyme
LQRWFPGAIFGETRVTAVKVRDSRGASMKPIQTVVETGIYADDLDAVEPFYRELLGLVLVAKERGRHLFFRVGESSMLLVFRPEATLMGDILPAHGCKGSVHFAMGIAREDLDAWRQRLRQHGVAIEHEESWQEGAYSLYFRDPAANLLELVTPGLWGLASGW